LFHFQFLLIVPDLFFGDDNFCSCIIDHHAAEPVDFRGRVDDLKGADIACKEVANNSTSILLETGAATLREPSEDQVPSSRTVRLFALNPSLD